MLDIIQKQGYVIGAVVKRKDAFGADRGYGILTGDLKETDESYSALCTDGSWFSVYQLEMIDDVK